MVLYLNRTVSLVAGKPHVDRCVWRTVNDRIHNQVAEQLLQTQPVQKAVRVSDNFQFDLPVGCAPRNCSNSSANAAAKSIVFGYGPRTTRVWPLPISALSIQLGGGKSGTGNFGTGSVIRVGNESALPVRRNFINSVTISGASSIIRFNAACLPCSTIMTRPLRK